MAKYCSFCGAEVAWDEDCENGCPACLADIAAGLIPAGLPPAGYNKFWLWKDIRQRERDVVAGRMSEEAARADVARMVENAKKIMNARFGEKQKRSASQRL